MAINAGTVLINVVANVGPFRQQMLGLGSTISKTGSTLSRFGVGLTRGVSLPLGLAGAAATKLAVDYDTAFTRIAAITGSSQKQIEKWKEQLKDLGAKTANEPRELAEALYFLASAGLEPTKVFPALVQSAKAAATGLGTTADVANIVASAMNAYAKSGLKASTVTDTLVAAVREGRAEPDEFANAMGRLLPIASKAEVEFENLAASLSVVSNIGLDVNEGVTAMRGLLQAIVAPGTQAAETMKKVGFTTQELRDLLAEEGILGAVRAIEEATKQKFGDAWLDAARKIVPNIRALTGALGLTVQEGERVDAVFRKVSHAVGDSDAAFEKAKEGAAFQFRQTMIKLKNVAIDLGEILIPILQDITGEIEEVIKWFDNLSDGTKEWIVKIGLFAVAFGPLLRIGGALITTFTGVFKLFGSIIGLVPKLAGATAAAAGAQQLTLFGPGVGAAGGAAAGASLFGPMAAAAAALTGTLIALKIAVDNDNEALDRQVELLRQGKISGTDLADTTENLRAKQDEMAKVIRDGVLPPTRAGIALNAQWQNQIDDNDEVVKRFTDGIRHMAASFGVSAENQSHLASIFKTSQDTTEKYRHRVAALVGGFETLGVELDKTTIRMVRNLLKMGDTKGAMKVLNDALDEGTRKQAKWGDATAKNAVDAAKADAAMKTLQGGIRGTGNAANDAEGKVRGYGDELRKVPKSVNTKVNVDTRQGLTAAQQLQGVLEDLGHREFTASVHVITTGGSTGFHLLEMLERELERITEEGRWNVNVKVGAGADGGPNSIQAINNHFRAQHQILAMLGSMADQVFAQEFPKAYEEDLKAFQKATQAKSKELEKALAKAEKDFEKLKSKVKEFEDAIKSGFVDAAGLISGALAELAKTTEVAGLDGETITMPTPGDLASYLQQQIAQSQEFAGKLAQLAAAGLAPKLLAELAQGGQESMPLIDALLAGGKDLIKEFNEANKTINAFANATADALSEEKFGGAIKRAANRIENLGQRIQNFNDHLGREINKLIDSLQTRRLSDNIEALINALRRSMERLGFKVPGMAEGGIVTSRRMVTVGEKGPEAIIPLSQLDGTMGGINVYVNVEGNAVYSRDLAAEVRDVLLRDKRFKGRLGLS